MMCLGWFNQMDCNARPNVEVIPATQTAAQAAGITGDGTGALTSDSPCPTSMWFWLIGAGIAVMGAVKK